MDEKQSGPLFAISNGWATVCMLCLSPILLIFNHLGHFREGVGAWGCAGVVAYAVKTRWDLSGHEWFWMIVALAIPLQIPFVLYFPWEDRNLTYVGLLPVGVLDFALIYGAIKLGEMIMRARAPRSPS